MEVLKAFPQMIPIDLKKSRYKGFIQVQGECFQLELQKQLESPGGAFVRCECKLREVLRGYEDLLAQRLKESPTVADFLQELCRLLELQLTKKGAVNKSNPPQFYSSLIDEIEAIGWDKLSYIDSQFSEIHLATEDSKARRHVLKVGLHAEHPRFPPKCVADLPVAFDFAWTPQSKLQDLLSQFSRHLELYQTFWDTMDEIDQKTWIIEPEKPTRADTGRRIALGNNASLQINVLVQYPQMLPECRFMGAEHVVGPLKVKLNENLHTWGQKSNGLYENLQKVLGVDFPSPTKTSKEDFSMECGICYAYRLGEEIPDQACDDQRCGQPFHNSCLYEWLRALPSFRQSFNIAFGECPYCSTPITVKMPTG